MIFNPFPNLLAFAALNLFKFVASHPITGKVLGLLVSDWPALQNLECFRALLSVKSLADCVGAQWHHAHTLKFHLAENDV